VTQWITIISLFLLSDNVTEMVVTWVTMDYTSDSIVEYNKKGGPLDYKAHGTVTKYLVNAGAAGRTMYIHRVTMTGLVPTQYYGKDRLMIIMVIMTILLICNLVMMF